jgi:hypothetical protein
MTPPVSTTVSVSVSISIIRFSTDRNRPLYDAVDRITGFDFFQDLGSRKYRAETSEHDFPSCVSSKPIQFLHRQAEPESHLFQKSARACSAFPIHLETDSLAGCIDFYDLIVLSAYVDDGNGALKEMQATSRVTRYFRAIGSSKWHALATVPCRDHVPHIAVMQSGALQGCGPCFQSGSFEIRSGIYDTTAYHGLTIQNDCLRRARAYIYSTGVPNHLISFRPAAR